MALLKGHNSVDREDIQKAALISLQGRTEVSSSSRYYDNAPVLFQNIIQKIFE